MALQLYDTYRIGSHFACPIENDDWSGLSQSDTDNLKCWLESLPEGPKTFNWHFYDEQGQPVGTNFARCAVSKLMSDVVEVDLMIDDGYRGLYKRMTHKYVGEYQHLDQWDEVATFRELCREQVIERDDIDASNVYFVSVHIKTQNKSNRYMKTIKQALHDHYTEAGCACEHDCCGCWSSYAGEIKHVGNGVYTLFVSTSQNY